MAIMQCWGHLFGTKLGHNWFRKVPVPSHYLHYCLRCDRRTLTTKTVNFNQINKKGSLKEMPLEILSVILAIILSRPPYVTQASANT